MPAMRCRRSFPVLLAASAAPLAALAHSGAGSAHHGWLAGLAHPLTGLDHLSAAVAVGLWSALAARRAWPDLLAAPLGFVALLAVGAVLGLGGLGLPAVEPMVAASLLVLGLLAASRWHMPVGAAAALAGLFALFHGAAHGIELADQARAGATLAGLLVATALLHATGLAAGWALRRANVWLPRAAGASVALLGLGLLTQRLI